VTDVTETPPNLHATENLVESFSTKLARPKDRKNKEVLRKKSFEKQLSRRGKGEGSPLLGRAGLAARALGVRGFIA
jgi:hypothetical protein